MKLLATAEQMKNIDYLTISEIGIPSLVLMENAALSIFEEIQKMYKKSTKFLVVCGSGNNAADGLALARILHNNDYKVSCYINNPHGKSDEFNLQLKIVKNLGIHCIDDVLLTFILKDYDVIVDAIFGIGLNSEIKDDYKFLVNAINMSNKEVISIDIPSGINATTGQVMGVAIKSKTTITFGVSKVGLTQYPGKEYAGKVIVKNIGFPKSVVENTCKEYYELEINDLKLPERKESFNKGDAGKILIISGSDTYYGSVFFATKACLKMGAGLVYVYTHEYNKIQLNSQLPEAIVYTYNSNFDKDFIETMSNKVDAILIGPGIGLSELSYNILSYVLKNIKKPTIIDADGINLIDNELINYIDRENVVITPHIVELKRLCKKIDIDTNKTIIEISREFDTKYNISLLIKDAISVVCDNNKIFFNTAGNSALAKGGSGDILSGIIAYLLARNIDAKEAIKYASLILGTLADNISKNGDKASILPSEILNNWSIYE